MQFAKPHPLLEKHLNASGFELCSVLDAGEWRDAWSSQKSPAELSNDLEFLKTWLSQGHQAGMGFLEKNLHAREDARNLLASVSSILSVIVPYATGERVRGQPQEDLPVKPPPPTATDESSKIVEKTARYARVPDYHKAIRNELEKVLNVWQLDALEQKILTEKIEWRVATDSLPFLDRAHARLGRLGFVGKNTMLIRPGIGSYFFIAHVLLSADFSVVSEPHHEKLTGADAIAQLNCGDCRRCLDACPTGALIETRTLDANKCLSYLTIEHRGVVDEQYLKHFDKQFYGCDICQEVCPYNFKTLSLKTIKPFQKPLAQLSHVSLHQVAQMSQIQYEQWFGGTAMTRAKYSGLVRNALYSLHATQDPQLPNILDRRESDPDPVVRAAVQQLREINKR